ncbi:MAG: hypothetical protein KAU28_03620, partial [Phycisphaerae bacterium]|nr:hypothetical protein [Phycisphaerae bacterium]
LSAADENVQCLAARGLAEAGRADLALDALKKLTTSKDLATANIARMSLLAMGYREYLQPLKKVVHDPATPANVVALLLAQIVEEKVAAALVLAEHLAATDSAGPIKVQAYRAISAVSPNGAAKLAKAISESDQTVFRASLLNVLASRGDATRHLKSLCQGADSVAALARFELYRPERGKQAASAAQRVILSGHPVVIGYILDRAGQDIKKFGREASFYTPVLLNYIRSVSAKTRQMQKEHFLAASAATLLADLGTPEAMAGLKDILGGPDSAIVRAVAAGLLRTKNCDACVLARPLLKSPYEELATDAALILGRFGDPGAAIHLRDILNNHRRHRPALAALASWYLLKISGKSADTAKVLADQIK